MKIVNTAVLTWSYKPGRESQYSLAFSDVAERTDLFERTNISDSRYQEPVPRLVQPHADVRRRMTTLTLFGSIFKGLDSKKVGTNRLSRNVGTELPLLAAK